MSIYRKFGVEPIINACGTVTRLGGAPMPAEVMEAFASAAEEAVPLEDLQAAGLMVKIEEHVYKRPYGDRSGVVIEPYMTNQWFVRAEPLAKPSIAARKVGVGAETSLATSTSFRTDSPSMTKRCTRSPTEGPPWPVAPAAMVALPVMWTRPDMMFSAR